MRSLKLAAYFCGTKIREKKRRQISARNYVFLSLNSFFFREGKKKRLSRDKYVIRTDA